jgi:cob(I)alamin adenosyltransferase
MPPTFFTRTGDDGETGLLGEGRISKAHPRIETLGTLEEASAALGVARANCQDARVQDLILEIQRDLYHIMTEVAATPENLPRFQSLTIERVNWLESQVDSFTAMVEVPHEFILPGDSICGATLSLARTIIRRAERRLAELKELKENNNPILLQYLNRLSSLCFILELYETQSAGNTSTLAKGELK